MYLHHLSKKKRKLFKQFWNQNLETFKKRRLKQTDVLATWVDGVTVGKLITERKLK